MQSRTTQTVLLKDASVAPATTALCIRPKDIRVGAGSVVSNDLR